MALKEMLYTYPQSWDDKNMDWENPDPRLYDYIISLILALRERIAVSFISSYSSSNPLSYNIPTRLLTAPPYSLFSDGGGNLSTLYIQYRIISETIKNICNHFVNWEKTTDANRNDIPEDAVSSSGDASRRYSTSFSCSIFWTWTDLCKEFPDLCLVPTASSLQIDHVNFIKACKNAIDKLTICTLCSRAVYNSSARAPYLEINVKNNYGQGWNYKNNPNESTEIMISDLNSNDNYTEIARSIYSTSPICIVIDNVSMGGMSWSTGYYDSGCRCEMIELKKIKLFTLPDRKAILKFVALTTNPSYKAVYPNSTGTKTYRFSNNGLPFNKGLSVITSEELTTSKELSQSFGNGVYTPPETYYPTEESSWIVNGCQVTLFPYIDYGVDGGFKFFTPSE